MNIVFDIGGTNMRVATAEGTTLGEIKKVPTPQDPEEGIAIFAAIANELSRGTHIDSVAGCIAGNISHEGVLSDSRNLEKWQGENIVKKFSEVLQVPVQVVNDAGAAGLGEAKIGGGKEGSIVAYITVSTGVGGARIVDGHIDAAGGIGRIMVGDSDLESSVSGTAVKKKFGIEPKELESIEERNKLADILAQGLVKVTEKWQPDTIVLGGSMIIGVNPIPLDRIEKTLTEMVLKTYPSAPTIKMAELGDNGGLVGAAILASEIRPN